MKWDWRTTIRLIVFWHKWEEGERISKIYYACAFQHDKFCMDVWELAEAGECEWRGQKSLWWTWNKWNMIQIHSFRSWIHEIFLIYVKITKQWNQNYSFVWTIVLSALSNTETCHENNADSCFGWDTDNFHRRQRQPYTASQLSFKGKRLFWPTVVAFAHASENAA